MSIRGIRESTVSVSMPAWAPGAYTIRDFARNVQDFQAANTRGQTLKWEQSDKQTWRIDKQPNDDVNVRYNVFSTQLTDEMADVSGPATFMYVVGQKHLPCSVKYDSPSGWNVYTGLEKKGDTYGATDYDIFSGRAGVHRQVQGSRIRGRRCQPSSRVQQTGYFDDALNRSLRM